MSVLFLLSSPKIVFCTPQRRHVAPINVKFGAGAPCYISRLLGQRICLCLFVKLIPRIEKPIFGLLSKNNTDMAVLCAGLPVKTDRCKLVTSTRDFTALYGITSNINNSSCLMNCLRAWKLYQAFLVLIHKVNV